mmetsp:Transcript_29687/g.70067  ORF Transcript_29687/g.70067 Transcript_29687/m.70067 type:complete len:177 (-) Transcript_29687:1563-2093(-)
MEGLAAPAIAKDQATGMHHRAWQRQYSEVCSSQPYDGFTARDEGADSDELTFQGRCPSPALLRTEWTQASDHADAPHECVCPGLPYFAVVLRAFTALKRFRSLHAAGLQTSSLRCGEQRAWFWVFKQGWSPCINEFKALRRVCDWCSKASGKQVPDHHAGRSTTSKGCAAQRTTAT